jgi:hypothetical protein
MTFYRSKETVFNFSIKISTDLALFQGWMQHALGAYFFVLSSSPPRRSLDSPLKVEGATGRIIVHNKVPQIISFNGFKSVLYGSIW